MKDELDSPEMHAEKKVKIEEVQENLLAVKMGESSDSSQAVKMGESSDNSQAVKMGESSDNSQAVKMGESQAIKKRSSNRALEILELDSNGDIEVQQVP